ncbi:hypothetical protein C8Q76DRAFT_697523 [Earliella scabrosa]|nr:hypothetical protein C8Q76DRAFT_697523 [Earliella scabrosa]
MASTDDINIPVAVTIIRPAHPGVRPPLFKAIEPPPTKLTLGSKVHLEIPVYRNGELWLVAPTGTKGTVISVVSLYLDAVEVIIRKDNPSGVYVYLVVPLEEQYITLPPRLFSGYLLIEPYLLHFSSVAAGGDPNNYTTPEEFVKYLSIVGFNAIAPQQCQDCVRATIPPWRKHPYSNMQRDAPGSDSGYESSNPTEADDEERDDEDVGLDRDDVESVTSMSSFEEGCRGKLRFWAENGRSLSRTPHARRGPGLNTSVVLPMDVTTRTPSFSPFYPPSQPSLGQPPTSTTLMASDLTTLKLRVAVRRPANSIRGGLYEVVERPSCPLRLGIKVSLNLNYVTSNRHGVFVHPWITVPTGIQGLVMGIEGMRTDALILLVCDESFGNAYEYLLVTTIFPGFIELPQSVWMGYALVKCSLLSTAVALSRGIERGGFSSAVGLNHGDGGSPWRPGVSDFVSWTPGSDAPSTGTSSRSPKAQRGHSRSYGSDWIGLDVITEETVDNSEACKFQQRPSPVIPSYTPERKWGSGPKSGYRELLAKEPRTSHAGPWE